METTKDGPTQKERSPEKSKLLSLHITACVHVLVSKLRSQGIGLGLTGSGPIWMIPKDSCLLVTARKTQLKISKVVMQPFCRMGFLILSDRNFGNLFPAVNFEDTFIGSKCKLQNLYVNACWSTKRKRKKMLYTMVPVTSTCRRPGEALTRRKLIFYFLITVY